LFVIDDGASMAREQALLAREIPRMVDVLMHGSQFDTGYVSAGRRVATRTQADWPPRLSSGPIADRKPTG
jgi:hypothetical protein